MDDLVKQAMAKWPNVPDCYGWLGLDARGNWYMRDDRAQAQGSFASKVPDAKGSLLKHEKLIEFIQRNYAADVQGQWYFQNGPQRVYVELEATPWIWRISDTRQITAHDGRSVAFMAAKVDEMGWLYLETSLGFGLVHTQDVAQAAVAIESGQWAVHDVARLQLPRAYSYVASPQALHHPGGKPQQA
jgi:hypothetical protein